MGSGGMTTAPCQWDEMRDGRVGSKTRERDEKDSTMANEWKRKNQTARASVKKEKRRKGVGEKKEG